MLVMVLDEFRCRPAQTMTPEHRDSPCRELRGKPIVYLDQQLPKCEANEVLTGFHLHSEGCPGNQMRYRTWCAKLMCC